MVNINPIISRLILTCILTNICIISYSQEYKILSKTLQSYKNELPKLEHQAFKILKKLDSSKETVKQSEIKKYHFIIIPMFKLKEDYIQYHFGDKGTFVKYIDFGKMHIQFDAFVFKDSIYKGLLHINYKQHGCYYDSVRDTNKYAKNCSFIGNKKLAYQIKDFNPDLVFFPECTKYICFIKWENFFIGEGKIQLQTLDYILPFEEFVIKYPSFISGIKGNRIPEFNNEYIELK